jgi:hypothetical protein
MSHVVRCPAYNKIISTAPPLDRLPPPRAAGKRCAYVVLPVLHESPAPSLLASSETRAALTWDLLGLIYLLLGSSTAWCITLPVAAAGGMRTHALLHTRTTVASVT